MIGAASDKFAGMRALATCVRQPLPIIKKKNKSIPRARKQKCQTHPPGCRNSWRLSRYEALVGPFFGLFGGILDEKRGWSCRSRLTFLTGTCQKCQTSFPERSRDGEKLFVPTERASPHNTPAPLHVGTLTRKVTTSPPPAPVPLQHPYELRTGTALNPFTRLSRRAVGRRPNRTLHHRFGSSLV
jgi:hypothetical protein